MPSLPQDPNPAAAAQAPGQQPSPEAPQPQGQGGSAGEMLSKGYANIAQVVKAASASPEVSEEAKQLGMQIMQMLDQYGDALGGGAPEGGAEPKGGVVSPEAGAKEVRPAL